LTGPLGSVARKRRTREEQGGNSNHLIRQIHEVDSVS